MSCMSAFASFDSEEEEQLWRSEIKGLFDSYDPDQTGTIKKSNLGAILEKLGRGTPNDPAFNNYLI